MPVLLLISAVSAGANATGESWWSENWFSLIQSLGILTGFLLGAAALLADVKARRADTAARRAETLVLITQHHREIWGRILDDGSLERVLNSDADLEKEPLTEKERMLCTFLILHLFASYEARKAGVFRADWTDPKDLAELFSLPVFAAVWEIVEPYQPRDFVTYMQGTIDRIE